MAKNQAYFDSVYDFMTTNSEKFNIDNEALISGDGMKLLLNIPESQRELLESEPTMTHVSGRVTEEHATAYALVITRAPDLSKRGSYYEGTGYTNYVFLSDSVLNSENNRVSGSNLGYWDGNLGYITIPFPADNTANYYYYAQVLKCNTVGANGRVWTTDYTATAITEDNCCVSVKSAAETILSRDLVLDDSERAWLQDTAGIKPDTNEITINVAYKHLQDGATEIIDQTYAFNTKSVYAQSEALIVSTLYNTTSFTNIAKFNVVREGRYYEGEYSYETGERIILLAKDYEYSYNEETQIGTLTVVYSEFEYKDFHLRITNNDPLDNLTMDYYTAAVVPGSSSTTMTFTYDTIQNNLYNSNKWIFTLKKENITVSNIPDGITVTIGEDALIITFPNGQENDLMNLSVVAIAEIRPDEEYSSTYEYTQLVLTEKGELVEKQIKTEAKIRWWSEITRESFENFMIDNGAIINEAAKVSTLDGSYIKPYDIVRKWDNENKTCNVVVLYDYNAIFKIINTYDNSIKYKALNNTSLTYNGEFFVGEVPSGYRVEKIESESGDLVVNSAESYKDVTVEVRTAVAQKIILPIRVAMTDKWHLVVNYFEQYKDTCFAEKKQMTKDVKVSDYADIYHLTKEDMKTILGVTDLSVLNSVTVDKINVAFDGVSTYTADLTYTHASLKQIDYDGNSIEIQIPLTSYADWCAQYGQEWSILFLNTPEKQYFKYSNDVERDKLYGLFSVAVFEEQVSDLNYWFQNNTGDGCMTIFDSRSVQGSSLYKFFDNMRTKGAISSVLGHVGMAFCEIFNDNNKVYQSYFFYLDGSSDNAFISNGGADNAGDTDDALTNKGEDIKDKIDKALNNSTFKTVLSVVAAVCVCGALVFVGYKVFKFFGGGNGKNRRRRR